LKKFLKSYVNAQDTTAEKLNKEVTLNSVLRKHKCRNYSEEKEIM